MLLEGFAHKHEVVKESENWKLGDHEMIEQYLLEDYEFNGNTEIVQLLSIIHEDNIKEQE
ncbi:hypothetical protein [Geosporobacter ferrireducens]|uniref:Uncharacterized protein n=1 Tax=Geosporobacter ferrireducens TaxID=1424294 RepID=A0A1D8GN34_9FIRM|nr:hypothetical protein [Geosporobacter ferrireducens]AOT72303.1 hypothetical protein Gferi_23800 [Geosporobacter ferrireducens]